MWLEKRHFDKKIDLFHMLRVGLRSYEKRLIMKRDFKQRSRSIKHRNKEAGIERLKERKPKRVHI